MCVVSTFQRPCSFAGKGPAHKLDLVEHRPGGLGGRPPSHAAAVRHECVLVRRPGGTKPGRALAVLLATTLLPPFRVV